MTLPNNSETARRYPEAYDWNVKREREGRRRIKHAPFLGILVGLGCSILLGQILIPLFARAEANPPVGALFLIVWVVSGLMFWGYWYNSGLKMVLSAQQMLVVIDTEHNTREIAEALRLSQTLKS